MTPNERASLAEQLLANPLFAELFNGVEHDATEAMIYATDDETRARAAMRVQAVRSLRSDCDNSLRATAARKVVA
jgi:hypothetical protein